MDDFASAVMMRLVAAGLARQGLARPARPPAGARVPRSAKRAALEAIMARHGALAVLRLADAIPDVAPHPVAEALARATDVPDLLARWRRLERFSHARHEVAAEIVDRNRARLVHRSREGGPPPSMAETLLVVAVLAGLAEQVTSRPVRLGPEGSSPWREGGRWCAPADAARSPIVLAVTGPPQPRTVGAPPADLVTTLRERIAADPVRRWRLETVAGEHGLGPRGLQRRLLAAGTSFSAIVSDARLASAAALLCRREGPGLAEVGFLSGYADQAHFTRAFTAAVGTTPRAYRADFADAA